MPLPKSRNATMNLTISRKRLVVRRVWATSLKATDR